MKVDLYDVQGRLKRLSSDPINYRYCANIHLTSATVPTHSATGYQKVGEGGVAGTWGSSFDIRPSGIAAQVDTSTNKRLDIKQSGIYQVNAGIYFGASVTSGVLTACDVYKNGTIIAEDVDEATSGGYTSPKVSQILSLVVGDYLELWAYRNSAGSSTYSTSLITQNYLEFFYLGPAS